MNPTTTKKQRTTITFSEQVCVRRVLHINDYSSTEFSSCWPSRKEVESSREEMRSTLRRMEQGYNDQYNSVVNDDLCTRGLEGRTQWRKKRTMRVISDMREAVMREQAYQWEHRQHNEERIAMVCRMATKKSMAMARIAALQDEEQIFKGLNGNSNQPSNYKLKAADAPNVVRRSSKNNNSNSKEKEKMMPSSKVSTITERVSSARRTRRTRPYDVVCAV